MIKEIIITEEDMQILREQIHRIQKLSATQLGEYEKQMLLNGWSGIVTANLKKALDIRQAEVFEKVYAENYMAVSSNISEVS